MQMGGEALKNLQLEPTKFRCIQLQSHTYLGPINF